jgi:aspartate racemase
MRKPIVILGGMGPQASLRFQKLLISKSARHHNGDGDQFPYIVHFSLPVADFISDASAKRAAASTINKLAPIIKRLEPAIITLACNTAHAMTADVPLLQKAPFVSMLEAVASKIERDGVTKIGLLASPTTIRSRLYADVLAQHGIGTIEPTPSQRRELETVIRAVIQGRAAQNHKKVLARIGKSLHTRGAEALLLGCTELPLIFDTKSVDLETYDCLDIYADAVITDHYCIMEVR